MLSTILTRPHHENHIGHATLGTGDGSFLLLELVKASSGTGELGVAKTAEISQTYPHVLTIDGP